MVMFFGHQPKIFLDQKKPASEYSNAGFTSLIIFNLSGQYSVFPIYICLYLLQNYFFDSLAIR